MVIYNFNNPGFVLFPIQNNRTGYKPFALPVILVVPWVRTIDGIPTGNTNGILDLQYLIDTIDGPIPVAGFDHQGLFVPDRARFKISVSSPELEQHAIAPSTRQFIDAATLTSKDFSKAVDGDLMKIQLTNGTISTILYYTHANYYDLSNIAIETINLQPYGH